MVEASKIGDVQVKIGGKSVKLSDLAVGDNEVISFDGQTLVQRRPNGTLDVSTVFDHNKEESRSRTIQAPESETNINMIIDRAVKGNLVMMNQREPRYGDFSSGFNFTETQMRIKAFESNFERLPSELRARFDNDPAKLIEFASDPANKEEAIKLGILPKEQVVEPVAPAGGTATGLAPAPVATPPAAPAGGSPA